MILRFLLSPCSDLFSYGMLWPQKPFQSSSFLVFIHRMVLMRKCFNQLQFYAEWRHHRKVKCLLLHWQIRKLDIWIKDNQWKSISKQTKVVGQRWICTSLKNWVVCNVRYFAVMVCSNLFFPASFYCAVSFHKFLVEKSLHIFFFKLEFNC